MKEILIQGLSQMGIVPPPGAVDQLCRYAQLLLEQNKVMNLTAITEPEKVARLHFLDSAAVLAWGGKRAGLEPAPMEYPSGPLGHLPLKGEARDRAIHKAPPQT